MTTFLPTGREWRMEGRAGSRNHRAICVAFSELKPAKMRGSLWRVSSVDTEIGPFDATYSAHLVEVVLALPLPDETPPAFIIDFLKEQERDKRERERRVRPEIPAPPTQEEEE